MFCDVFLPAHLCSGSEATFLTCQCLLATPLPALCSCRGLGSVCLYGLGLGSFTRPGERSRNHPHHHHHVPGATRPQARHPQGRAPAPWAATHGGVLCQWHDQALSWKLTEGRQRGKRLDFLLCTPWIAPQTHRSRRIEGKNAQVLSPSALKSHHFSVGLKGCADPLRSFASALD